MREYVIWAVMSVSLAANFFMAIALAVAYTKMKFIKKRLGFDDDFVGENVKKSREPEDWRHQTL